MNSPSKKLVALAIAIAIVALGVAFYAGYTARQFHRMWNDETTFNAKVETGIQAFIKKQQAQQQAAQAGAAEPVDVKIGDSPVKGDANAKVTIIEFSDFECPFCGRYFAQTLPDITKTYIDTGKVKYAFRNFPLGFHQNAKPAALAAACVYALGGNDAFWKYHDTLYSNQKDLGPDNYKKWAKTVGVDEAKFTTCFDSKQFEAKIDADQADGQKAGVQGTPAFFIDGRLISGAQPFSVFQQVIDEELKK